MTNHPNRSRNYPVFDANKYDADRDTLAHPIGRADTPEKAKAIAGNFFATKVDDGGEPITVYAVELEQRFGVTGWFPVWA